MRFTALDVARMSSTAQKTHPMGPRSMFKLSARVKPISVWTSVKVTMQIANPNATARSPMTFAFLLRPRLRSRVTLMPSSSRPTRPAPKMARITKMPVRV